MSSKRLGKRERLARKRKISIRRTKTCTTVGSCSKCATPTTCRIGPHKEKSLFFKLVCGQCRKSGKRALEYGG
jgi:hypothetical protein